jgi:hypothetical protein
VNGLCSSFPIFLFDISPRPTTSSQLQPEGSQVHSRYSLVCSTEGVA